MQIQFTPPTCRALTLGEPFAERVLAVCNLPPGASTRCRATLIMSPYGLVRNVPYSKTSMRGRIGKDTNEQERVATGRDPGASSRGRAKVDRRGDTAEEELSAGKADVAMLPAGRTWWLEAWQRGERIESSQAEEIP